VDISLLILHTHKEIEQIMNKPCLLQMPAFTSRIPFV